MTNPRGLTITDVSHRFGSIVAADHVHLGVQPGQVHCLLGPSGSGKSTLLRLVSGLEKLQEGTIEIGDETVARRTSQGAIHLAPEQRAVGFVFQDYALFPHLDARHNVAFGMESGSKQDKLRRADEWLKRVDLAGHRSAMPHTLSGGQQQRVALARSLAREPAVMLLDEPFSGLDLQLRADVRRTTLELLRETAAATLMITHDPREALLAGDVVSVIREGRILQNGSPSEVYRRPVSREVAEIFGPVNVWPATAQNGWVDSPWGELEAPAQDSVEILVRPDALLLTPAGESPPADAARGSIVEVADTGTLANVRVELGDRTLEVQDLSRRGWRVGQSVDVALEPGSALVLPA